MEVKIIDGVDYMKIIMKDEQKNQINNSFDIIDLSLRPESFEDIENKEEIAKEDVKMINILNQLESNGEKCSEFY